MPAASQKSAGSPAPPRRASDLLERRVQAMPHAYATLVILSQADRLTTKELRWTSIFVRPPVSGLSLGRVLRKPGRAWPGRWWGSRVVPVARSATGHSLLLEIGPDIDASAWPVRLMSRSVTAVPGDHRRRPD